MTILLPAFGLAFVAVCIWLAVRIVNRRERWAKRTAAGMFVVFVVYSLSLGPVGWINSRTGSQRLNDATLVIYIPVLIVGLNGPEPLRDSFERYMRFCGLENHD